MNFLKKLFGAGEPSKSASVPVEYNGYRIFAAPTKEAGGYRVSARIEKDFEAETKAHTMVRADVITDYDEAVAATVAKCQHVIDQQGDQIF